MFSIQKHVENAFENVAKSTKQNCVLLCDRGAMDGSAYIDRDEFVKIVRVSSSSLTSTHSLRLTSTQLNLVKQETGSDIPTIRDSQYDGIMHLVSAADGAESFYSLANNLARSEPVEYAREVDMASQHAWSGHPHHFIL